MASNWKAGWWNISISYSLTKEKDAKQRLLACLPASLSNGSFFVATLTSGLAPWEDVLRMVGWFDGWLVIFFAFGEFSIDCWLSAPKSPVLGRALPQELKRKESPWGSNVPVPSFVSQNLDSNCVVKAQFREDTSESGVHVPKTGNNGQIHRPNVTISSRREGRWINTGRGVLVHWKSSTIDGWDNSLPLGCSSVFVLHDVSVSGSK